MHLNCQVFDKALEVLVNYELVKSSDQASVRLAGPFDEDSDLVLKKLANEIDECKGLHFYFAESTSINSLGVRAWVKFLTQVEIGRQVYYHEVVPEVLMQMNMIQNFKSTGKVQSFYITYRSPATQVTQTFLLHTKDFVPHKIPDPPLCPVSGLPMEAEELEDEYFVFWTKP
jgi:hypothetical protein